MGRRHRRHPVNKPRCLHSVERVTAFQIKATTLASSSSCLKRRHVVDVFSEADFGPTTRTSIFWRNFAAFCKKSTAPRKKKRRQTAANDAKRRRLYYRPPSKYRKTRVIANRTPKILENLEVFKVVLPNNGPLKVLLKLKTFFLKLFSCYVYGSWSVLFRSLRPKRCFPYLGASRCRF